MNSLIDHLKKHGCRVRRSQAMMLLGIADAGTWRKVLDANPQLKHRLPGERQDKYVTAEIFRLLPADQRCATGVEEVSKPLPKARP